MKTILLCPASKAIKKVLTETQTLRASCSKAVRRCKQTGPITIHCTAASAQCNKVSANVSNLLSDATSHTVHVVNTACSP